MNFYAGDQFIDPNTDEVFHIQEMEEILVHPFKRAPFIMYSYFLQGTHGNEYELDHYELINLLTDNTLIEEL